MGDYIIDTNVLLVASAQHPGGHFKDSQIPAVQKQIVLDWLMEFRQDGQRKMILDETFMIWKEYNNKMTGQDIGLLVVMEKLQSFLVRFVNVAYDSNGNGRLPQELEQVVHDPSDRKFVAAALEDISCGGQHTIINAVDTDWCDWEEPLKRYGIAIRHLIEGCAGTGNEPG